MEKLKKHIKEGNIQGIYLLYGEEKYIITTYINKMIKMVLNDSERTMNLEQYSDSKIDFQVIYDATQTLPFFADKRVVVMSNLLAKKNVSKESKLLETIEDLPSTTVLIIVEESIDKRSKLYKTIQKVGMASEFTYLNEKQLVSYIIKELRKKGKHIDAAMAAYLIHTIGYNLTTITNELNKLIDYIGEGESIKKVDIDDICIRSIENRIFDLVDSMGRKEREKALSLYNDLITMREPTQRILSMVIRQFRLNYKTMLLLKEGHNIKSIASNLKIPPFVANKCVSQSKQFTEKQLKAALNDCLELDIKSKTGKMNPIVGIEMIIMQYGS